MSDKQIVVNSGGYEFTFDESQVDQIEVLDTNTDRFGILFEHDSLKGKLNRKLGSLKNYKVEFEGETFDVKIKTELDQRLDSMGLNAVVATKLTEIKAPMPGLVIEISVEEGQELVENDKLLVLEAMKMENVLKIPHEGKIKKIHVTKGQAVDKGQLLIELE